MRTRSVAVLVLLAHCAGVSVGNAELNTTVVTDSFDRQTDLPPKNVTLFDLHEPDLMSRWSVFLATTPMLNEAFLPPELQNRLTDVVATYRTLTPPNQPEFFVATYLDLLADRLLSARAEVLSDITPMRVCPVFASGHDASVSSLLAKASGLPAALFADAPGQPERYRYLFLQTEYSHCRFLATIRATGEARTAVPANPQQYSAPARLTFNVGVRPYTAMLSTTEELRALLETVGDIDAVTAFRTQMAGQGSFDEAEVFIFVRLLSLLTTDGNSGYAAIPVLYPLLSGSPHDVVADKANALRVSEALEHSYLARSVFRKIVPFAIRNTDDLLLARAAVMQALSDEQNHQATDRRVVPLLDQFVTGSGRLLEKTLANQSNEKMPLIMTSGTLSY